MRGKISNLVWLCAVIASVVFVGNVVVIWYDVWLKSHGLATISWRCLVYASAYPALAFVLCFVCLVPYCSLAGHLFWPRSELGMPDTLFAALAGCLCALIFGFWVGHAVFGQ